VVVTAKEPTYAAAIAELSSEKAVLDFTQFHQACRKAQMGGFRAEAHAEQVDLLPMVADRLGSARPDFRSDRPAAQAP
jgi:hypothetical protein